jgi:predicted histone-like DNA-binding protein
MAKYIKQELPDLQQTGEQKVYYRLKTNRNIDTPEFVRSLSHAFNGMKEGDIIRVLMATADHLGELLGEGYSVTLNGIGNFKATIGLEEDKELDTLDGNETKRNARSLQLKGVNYRADKELIKKASQHCKLEREGIARIHRSPYSKEERLTLALEYLEKHGAMKVANYMELTGLSRTAATLELQEFRRDITSGIDFIGRGSAKVYVKRAKG